MSEYSLKLLKIQPQRIALLNKMGIYTIKDLVLYYPSRYDVIEQTPLIDEQKVMVEGILLQPPRIFFKGRLSRMSFSMMYQDRELKVTIFNRHFLKKNMVSGMTLSVIGKYNKRNDTIVATDIKLQPIGDICGIRAVYTLKEKITQKSFQGYIDKALKFYQGHIQNSIPDHLMDKYQLVDRQVALMSIHHPEDKKQLQAALKYLKYEEFYKFQMTMQYIHQTRSDHIGIKKEYDENVLQQFIQDLPFSLTDDQKQTVQDICDDLKAQKMMYRFVQGDVGSGKTIVGAIGLYANYLAGYQGAFMAPTEILASQHYQSLSRIFKNTDVKLCLLTGHLSNKEKNELYQKIKEGKYDIIIGTHALFQEKVEYHRLSMVITDEQHRFGVMQRKALKDKGEKVDFLIMSATPIPRTLALSLYGDMDVSTISTLPKGRKVIQTHYVPTVSMKPILTDLKDYLSQGGQVYVVCPLVDKSENYDGRDATQIHDAMARYFQGQYVVGLIHGQMDDQQKNDIYQQFINNEIQILVSTTVIEVGIDVSNANMIIIYNAERFGLSQLHQLRGRVGRGQRQGYCYLLSKATNKEAIERLQFLCQHHDGFEVSQYDLQIRGPGDVLGQKQSGIPTFALADVLKDSQLLQVARDDAIECLKDYQDDIKVKAMMKEIQNNLSKNNEYVD